MPELPEVETIVADLRPHLVGRIIVRCELRSLPHPVVRYPQPQQFVDSIAGLRIDVIGRRGKFILIALDGGRMLVVHLGMSGQLRLIDAGAEIANHTHAIFDLDNGKQLRYRDPRRFGRLLLGTETELLDSGTFPRLGRRCSSTKRPSPASATSTLTNPFIARVFALTAPRAA